MSREMFHTYKDVVVIVFQKIYIDKFPLKIYFRQFNFNNFIMLT